MRAANRYRLALLALVCTQILPAVVRGQPAASSQGVAGSLQPFIDRHVLAGAVTLVASKDKTLDLGAVGYADLAAKKEMQKDDLFWIASMSKPITASAFMMLVDEGKIRLDDPVTKYLPEFRDQWLTVEQDKQHLLLRRPEHPVTVRNLLSHTSGLPFKSALEEPTLDLLPLRIAVRSYAMTPLLYEPGTKYQYSNAGINTAGRIIEVVSGMPYEQFLDQRLFGPLGMKDTTFWPNEKQIARLAKSYRPKNKESGLVEIKIGQLKYPLDNKERQPMPAGGLFSTATDVARFCQMVLNKGTFNGKRILSEDAVKQMTSKQTGDEVKDNYGLGWNAGETCGHGGAHATGMRINRKTGLITVWMVQHAGFPGDGGKAHGVFEQEAAKRFAKAGN
jgi:CubicO group peptidase (beta-lactamase class C family)